jgi:hypothetical protein
MFFSSSLNSDDSTSSSSDEDILEGMDQNDLVFCQMMATMASNTNDLFNSHEMEDWGGGSICGPDRWCLVCFGYNVNHINIIQDFNKLYIGGILQVGFSSGPYHYNPC